MTSVLKLASQRHREFTALLGATPDALLGAWALRNSGNAREAARLLSETFRLTPDDAKRAIGQARLLPTIASRGPLDGIAGYSVPRATWTALWNWATATCGQRKTRQKINNLQREMRLLLSARDNGDAIRRAARTAANVGGPIHMFVVAALIASLAKSDGFYEHLGNAFPNASSWDRDGKPSSRDRRLAHLVAMAFALSCVSNDGIALPGGPPWRDAPLWWTTSVAPWIAPLLATDCGDALRNLLTAMWRRRIRPAAPHEQLPSLADPGREMLANATAMASALKPHIRKASTLPITFSGGPNNLLVMIAEGGDYVYGCVAENGTGVVVGFEKASLLPFGLPHEASSFCTALAIAWYVDTAVVIPQRNHSYFRKTSSGPGAKGITYRPTVAFGASVRRIATGDEVAPRPRHFVMAHPRVLPPEHRGSEEARRRAPRDVQKELERYPNMTWVREHWRGKEQYRGKLKLHLTKHSTLATLLGSHRSGSLEIEK